MTENTTDNSVIEPQGSAPETQDASGAEIQEKQDVVAYETYRRTLGEAKKHKSEVSELRAKLEQYEEAKLKDEGKWQELAQSANQRASEIEGKYKALEAQVAEERIRSQVELKAKDLGCVDTDLLIKAMDVESLDVVDGYRVSPQSLELVLQKAKQDKPYLFSKPAPSIQDGVPRTSEYNGKVDLSKMTTDEIIKMARAKK